MKLITRGLVASAAAVATLLGVAAPAHAGSEDSWVKRTVGYSSYKSEAGEALFFAWDERLFAFDWVADGAGVRVYYSEDYGAWHYRTDTNGASGEQGDWNLDYPENKSFRFYVCLEDGGTTIWATCSATVYAHT
jgi:hypothetical protein